MRTKILFLNILVVSLSLANPQIDALFAVYDKPNVPGASVAVIKHGNIVYEKGYGLADLGRGIQVGPRTNFRLASLSKQFTATAILILIQDGKLSLETRLNELFSDFPEYGKRITVRHLLNHTGGLKDYEDLIPAGKLDQLSDVDVYNLLKAQTSPSFKAGDEYHYSNGGYVLLGLIVEKASGVSFSEFLRARVFNPLEMYESLMYEKDHPVVLNRAYGYSPSGTGFTKTDQSATSATRGDGGVYTSVHDWLNWENAIQHHVLVNEALQTLAFTPGKLNDGSATHYGFGWMLDSFQGLVHQYHTGSTIGFRTAVERFPSKELCVVVLVNRANSSPWDIAKKIAQLYLP